LLLKHPCTLEMIQRKQSHNCCTHKSHKLYEEGRQEKVKSRSITNDKKMNIHMPSINV
ncbi:hypothetical protein T4C_4783, partial [Trichinella pseudospiralis]